jgi:hypothetical protein
MNIESDVARFVKEPSLLIDLCREVIDRLNVITDDTETTEREAQLREISRSIERLEKQGIAIPEPLRAEKTRLASLLGMKADTTQPLHLLADAFEAILKDLKEMLGRSRNSIGSKKLRGKHSRTPKTDKKALRMHIIRALKKLGGKAHVSDIIKEIGRQLNGKLLPGDLEWRESTNEYAWQNNAKWERFSMTQDGVLRSDSPRGYWELNEDHR